MCLRSDCINITSMSHKHRIEWVGGVGWMGVAVTLFVRPVKAAGRSQSVNWYKRRKNEQNKHTLQLTCSLSWLQSTSFYENSYQCYGKMIISAITKGGEGVIGGLLIMLSI